MMTYTCDFKDCDSTVRDHRKIYICRQNPQNIYFRIHVCDNHQFQLENYIKDNLRKNETDNDKPF